MPAYRYQVRTQDGRLQNGIVEAPTQEAASQALEERNYEILSLDVHSGVEAKAQSLIQFLNRISAKEMVGTVRMLAVMISASVPIPDAVRNISHQTKNPRFKVILADIANEIEGGSRLSEALDRYPNVFSQFFINMVRSGETTGQLSDVLNYLADQQERDYDMMSKLRGALMYPAVIVVGMSIVGFIMMVYVVPKLTEVLIEAQVELPLATKILIGASNIMAAFWWLIIIGVIALGVGFTYWIKTDYGSYVWDSLKLRLPIFGRLFRDMYVVRFCQSMQTLMKGGVTLIQALEIASAVMGNAVWKKMIVETIQEVNDGNSLVTVMQREKIVPSMVVQMLTIGEETGRLDDVLRRVGDFYARSVANMTANMMTLIEPIIMIILGLAVGGMVSAIMLPMYKLSSAT